MQPTDAIDDSYRPDIVTAHVFGKSRRVRLVTVHGYYHVIAESIDGEITGTYLIDAAHVVPGDREKFEKFAKSH